MVPLLSAARSRESVLQRVQKVVKCRGLRTGYQPGRSSSEREIQGQPVPEGTSRGSVRAQSNAALREPDGDSRTRRLPEGSQQRRSRAPLGRSSCASLSTTTSCPTVNRTPWDGARRLSTRESYVRSQVRTLSSQPRRGSA